MIKDYVTYLEGAARIWSEEEECNKQVEAWAKDGPGSVDAVIIKGIGKIPHESVLDFACGAGRWYELLSTEQYLGVDASPLMLAEAQRTHPDNNYVLSRIEDYVPERTFDVALLVHVMNHCEAPERLLDVVLKNIEGHVDYIVTSYYIHNWQGKRYTNFGSRVGMLSRSVESKWVDEVINTNGWVVVFREDVQDPAHAAKELAVRVDVLHKKGSQQAPVQKTSRKRRTRKVRD